MRKAEIYLYNRFAGILIEDENGYSFEYDKEYLANTPKTHPCLRSLYSPRFAEG